MGFNKKSREITDNIHREMVLVYEDYIVSKTEHRIDSAFNTYISIQVFHKYSQKWVIRWDFYPHPATGQIANVAIYADELDLIFLDISTSRLCFNLPITDVSIDNQGMLPYIDIYIRAYNENTKGYPFEPESN
ncbi:MULTISPECIES: hypothetical protein [Bacteria]|uniref:hypothetical protein n=1 Tax=Bacteria TaxID=2 RepID=UPI00321FA794